MFVLAGLALALKILQINLTSEGVRLVRIIGIMASAFAATKIVQLGVAQMERMVADEDPTHQSEAEKRASTLGKIINSVGLIVIMGCAAMMILSEFGMNITPIITGAGIVGLAVGFGAQDLVRDIISGFLHHSGGPVPRG